MFGIQDLWLFVLTGIALNLTPGTDTALVISRSVSHGTRAGIGAAVGIGIGCFAHIVAAALGLSALLYASEYAFTLIKWLGAAYLCYLGLKLLGSKPVATLPDGPALARSGIGKPVIEGILTNLLNPKVALFFMAFLPQFVAIESPDKTLALLTLGLVFNTTGTIWNLILAWMGGTFRTAPVLPVARLWLERILGGVFLLLAARLASAARMP